jgi:hypothetical protein
MPVLTPVQRDCALRSFTISVNFFRTARKGGFPSVRPRRTAYRGDDTKVRKLQTISGGQSPLSHTSSISLVVSDRRCLLQCREVEEPAGLKTKRINASHPQLVAAGLLTSY